MGGPGPGDDREQDRGRQREDEEDVEHLPTVMAQGPIDRGYLSCAVGKRPGGR